MYILENMKKTEEQFMLCLILVGLQDYVRNRCSYFNKNNNVEK